MTAFNIGVADSLHAASRDRFAAIVQRANTLKTEGTGDERAVTELVTEIGVGILDRADTPEFWDALWNLCGALAYAAVETTKEGQP
jgi:hypothetical protein